MVKRVHLPDGLVDDLHDSLAESDSLEEAWTELSAQDLPLREESGSNGHAGNGHTKTPIERIFKPTRIDAGDDVLLR